MKPLNRQINVLVLAGAALLAFAVTRAAVAQEPTPSKTIAAQTRVSRGGVITTVKGYVIDSACTFRNDLKKPVSPECAAKCAKSGSPLVIQTEDGVIYWPISADMPATNQNDKLMPYAGKMVVVTGRPYSKGGSKAIIIEKIEPLGSAQ